MAHLSLALLGPLQITLDGQPISGLAYDQVRALLAYLAVEADRPQRRDMLAGLLWPEQPDQTARNNLRQALATLRLAISDAAADPQFLLISRETVQFNRASDHDVDVATFSALLTACDQHPHATLDTCPPCAERRAQVAALYRGDFLAGFFVRNSPSFEEWALVVRQRLHQQVLEALDQLAADHERRGAYAETRRAAWQQLALDPWREEAHRQLMRALALSGERSAALAQYERCRRVLADELGVEPAAETTALYQRIRAGTLDALVVVEQQAVGVPPRADPPRHASSDPSVSLARTLTPARLAPREPRPTNLPASPTPLIGRDQEIATVRGMLLRTDIRLLTLIGPPGVGKTRLSLHVAANLQDAFADGLCYVPLAPIRDPNLVIATIAQTLGVRETGSQPLLDSVKDYLRAKQLLLVLDNFEQLLAAAPRVAELLAAAPQLKLLITSRAVLQLSGEHQYVVPPLAVPDRKRLPPLATLTDYAAVVLFVARAKAVQPTFVLTDATAASVAEICYRLDGLPLALELAAARIKLFAPPVLLARLDQRLTLLTGGARDLPAHQQTLRSTIDWSYHLLTAEEQTLFARLGVFVGGWTLEAAEAMGPDLDILDVLAQLVNQSLVVVEEQDSAARYRLLETIRQYACDKLLEIGAAAQARDRHLDYYLRFAETWEPQLLGLKQLRRLDQCEIEHDNVRAALRWGLERDVDAALRLAGSLAEFWVRRGHATEGRSWLQELLDRVAALPELLGEAARRREAARAKALIGLSNMALQHGDSVAGLAACEESVRLYRQLGDRRGLGFALAWLGSAANTGGDMAVAERAQAEAIALGRESGDTLMLAFALGVRSEILLVTRGDVAAARAACEESARLSRAAGAHWGAAQSLRGLARIAAYMGHWDEARARCREAAGLFREMGDRYLVNLVQSELAHIERRAGNLDAARRLYQQSIVVWQNLGQRAAIAHQLECYAFIAGAQHQLIRAARLFGAAEALREALGTPMTALERTEYDREVAELRGQMDAKAYAANWAAGRAMTMEQAIAEALSRK